MKITIILFILLLTIGVSAQNSVSLSLIQRAEKISGDQFSFTAKTKKGAIIYGVKKPNKAMLQAIDKGLNDLFKIAKKHKYNQRLKHSDYLIFIAKPDRLTDSDGNYIPNFAIPLGQYAGTDYDKGGFMYAAGLVLSNEPCAFMIAENEKKLEQVSEVVRFEGEHLILYHNDRQRYNETADHSKGGGHPILQ
jgi:hypothetical protein